MFLQLSKSKLLNRFHEKRIPSRALGFEPTTFQRVSSCLRFNFLAGICIARTDDFSPICRPLDSKGPSCSHLNNCWGHRQDDSDRVSSRCPTASRKALGNQDLLTQAWFCFCSSSSGSSKAGASSGPLKSSSPTTTRI